MARGLRFLNAEGLRYCNQTIKYKGTVAKYIKYVLM